MDCMRLSDADVCKTEKLFGGSQYPSWEPLWHRDWNKVLCVGRGHQDLTGKDDSPESHWAPFGDEKVERCIRGLSCPSEFAFFC